MQKKMQTIMQRKSWKITILETLADIVTDTSELARKGMGRWGGPSLKGRQFQMNSHLRIR